MSAILQDGHLRLTMAVLFKYYMFKYGAHISHFTRWPLSA